MNLGDIISAFLTTLLSSNQYLVHFLADFEDGGAHVSDLSTEAETLHKHKTAQRLIFPTTKHWKNI